MDERFVKTVAGKRDLEMRGGMLHNGNPPFPKSISAAILINPESKFIVQMPNDDPCSII